MQADSERARSEPRIPNPESRVGGIILAGGKSTRMGTSKALLPFGAETMLQRVVRLLSGVVSPIVVVAATGQELPSLPPDVIVTRDEQESRGPLEGLRAGLKALPEDVAAAYVTSCDVPLLETGFVQQIIGYAQGHDIAVMEIDGFPHPLSAVYRRSTLPHVEALLAQDRLRPVFLFYARTSRTCLIASLSALRCRPSRWSRSPSGRCALRS